MKKARYLQQFASQKYIDIFQGDVIKIDGEYIDKNKYISYLTGIIASAIIKWENKSSSKRFRIKIGHQHKIVSCLAESGSYPEKPGKENERKGRSGLFINEIDKLLGITEFLKSQGFRAEDKQLSICIKTNSDINLFEKYFVYIQKKFKEISRIFDISCFEDGVNFLPLRYEEVIFEGKMPSRSVIKNTIKKCARVVNSNNIKDEETIWEMNSINIHRQITYEILSKKDIILCSNEYFYGKYSEYASFFLEKEFLNNDNIVFNKSILFRVHSGLYKEYNNDSIKGVKRPSVENIFDVLKRDKCLPWYCHNEYSLKLSQILMQEKLIKGKNRKIMESNGRYDLIENIIEKANNYKCSLSAETLSDFLLKYDDLSIELEHLIEQNVLLKYNLNPHFLVHYHRNLPKGEDNIEHKIEHIFKHNLYPNEDNFREMLFEIPSKLKTQCLTSSVVNELTYNFIEKLENIFKKFEKRIQVLCPNI